MTELRVFGSADRYLQGPGAIDEVGEHCAALRLGERTLVLIDAFMLPTLEQRLTTSFESAAIVAEVRGVSAEVTQPVIDAFAADAADHVAFVVGVGGGKTIDIAKGVALRLGVRMVTVPTIASNDSPASRAIAVYDEHHQLTSVPTMPRNPAIVVVDTCVIAGAPARFLAAGIGDALSKHAEVEACHAAGSTTLQGTRGLRIASILAAGCYEVLRANAVAAFTALKAGRIDQAFEDTVEAVVLLSGLAFENGGLSIAHALTRGLMAVPATASCLHGEHVAYGLLVQRVVAGAPDDEVLELAAFLRSIGLPASFAELGGVASSEAWETVVKRTFTAPHIQNVPGGLTEEALTSALLRVEALNR